MKKLIVILVPAFIFACGGEQSSPAETSPETVQKEDSIVSEPDLIVSNELPAKNGFSILADEEEYTISEALSSINSEYNTGQKLSIVKTEDEELLLLIAYNNSEDTETWRLGIDVVYGGLTSVRMEYADINKDDLKDELVIWWEQYEGNNGMQSGYESEKKGLIIIDVMNRNEMLNFIYSSHYASYSAGADADVTDPDYHAKMADDSDWDICSYSHTVTLVNNEIQISEYYKESEGTGECVLQQYTDGTYVFNVGEEKFRLKQ